MSALANARRRTTLLIGGEPLPECFAEATLAAALNAYERNTKAAKASRRRLVGKVIRTEERRADR